MGILSIAMDSKRVTSYPFGGRHAKQSKIKYKLEKLFNSWIARMRKSEL